MAIWLRSIPTPKGHYEIYMAPGSGGRPGRVTIDRANDSVPSFSRDGKMDLPQLESRRKVPDLGGPPTGGDAVQVTHNGGFVAFESPDGAYVYYTQAYLLHSVLWRLPASGGQPVQVLKDIFARGFVVLEQGIYYLHQPAGEAQLEFLDFATGKSITVGRNSATFSAISPPLPTAARSSFPAWTPPSTT